MRKFIIVAVVATALILTACGGDDATAPVQHKVDQPVVTVQPGQIVACDYGQSIKNGADFLNQHASDQKQLDPGWVRAVVVKTTMDNHLWTGTLVLEDGSLAALSAGRSHDTGADNNQVLNGLVTVGDYIAFDNHDHDFIISPDGPYGPKDKDPKELEFLGHSLFDCKPA